MPDASDKGHTIRINVTVRAPSGEVIAEQDVVKHEETDLEFFERAKIAYASLLVRRGLREDLNEVLGPPGKKP